MVSGCAMNRRQASQAASRMSSQVSKTRGESQVWRRDGQTFSTGFSSGAREGSRIRVMFFGTGEGWGCVPAGPIEQQDGVGALGDGAGDLVEVELHRVRVGEGWRQGGTGAAGRTDGAEEVGALVALVGRLARPRSAPRPLPNEAVLLADAGLVLTRRAAKQNQISIGLRAAMGPRWALSVSGKFFSRPAKLAVC